MNFVKISCHIIWYSWGTSPTAIIIEFEALANGSSDGSDYCIFNARSKAMQFGVNVSTIQCLVRRLRETGRVVDIRLACLHNRHATATETAVTSAGNIKRHIHPKKCKESIARGWYTSTLSLRWSDSHSCITGTSYGLVGGTCSPTIFNEAMEMGLFHSWVLVHTFSSRWSTSWGTLRRWLRSEEG